jgi:hypothetical protein
MLPVFRDLVGVSAQRLQQPWRSIADEIAQPA